VIRSDGTLAEPVAAKQAARLRREGVAVVNRRAQKR
jgi:alkylated DNA nucleotide flippase Atl1